MFSRASCQTREEHRLERIFLPSIGNLLFAPLLALLAAFQHFAFLPTTLFWQTGDLPNIRVHGVSAIFCTPYFLALSVWLCGFSIDKMTMLFSNRDDFLCIELSTLLMPCFAGRFAIIELLFACATSFAAFFAQVRCDADVLREIMKECRNWWSKEKKKTKTPFARICYFVFICAIVSKIFPCFWWKLVLYYYQ